MTKDEALKLALEFIERVNKDGWILADFEPQMYAIIAAIKEALEQRTWQGLTDKAITQVIDSMPKNMKGFMVDWDLYEFAQTIEAKLKQKNGYAEENT